MLVPKGDERSMVDTIHEAIETAWLTPGAAARLVSVGRRTIYREVRRGRLRAARIGGRREIRIHRSWLDAWLTTLAERS